MQLNPYLTFNGQCEAAFKFYERCLGGKIEAMMPHAGTPAEEHVPVEWRDKIMHARLAVGDGVLMGSDAPPERLRKAARVFRLAADQGSRAGGPRLSCAGGKRRREDADSADLLGCALRHARRPLSDRRG